jgi:ribonuclease BN (tRNA processing enzyme)
MKLTLCGTAAGPFTAQRASSGYVLQDGGHSLMLDCGPGSVKGALTAGIELRDIDAIVLSHLHEDHCIDLGAFALQAMYGRFERLPLVFGPPGAGELVPQIMRVYRSTATLPPPQVIEIDSSDEREICGFVVRSEETPHAPDLHAFSRRFSSNGSSFVFSGDTQANPNLMSKLAADADLLLHESFSTQGLQRYAELRTPEQAERLLARLPTTHSNVRDVARIAQDASVKRLVLTHVLPTEVDDELRAEAAAIYSGELTVGRDGLVFEF